MCTCVYYVCTHPLRAHVYTYPGVPVVTLAGKTHGSRVGVTLLHQVGLDDLVAEEPGCTMPRRHTAVSRTHVITRRCMKHVRVIAARHGTARRSRTHHTASRPCLAEDQDAFVRNATALANDLGRPQRARQNVQLEEHSQDACL